MKNVFRRTKARIRLIELSPEDFKAALSRKRFSSQDRLKMAQETVQFRIIRHPFLHGMGSVMDLAGTAQSLPRRALSGMEADRRAMASDWKAVGGDFRSVLKANPLPEAVNE
jgi:hypothetical protein